jgi:serine/threonine protein kinase
MTDLIGHTLGQYRIVEEIGRGGMAIVYRAVQPSIGREVAIKVLPTHYSQDAAFLQRFSHEVQVIASLQHPHILRVYDFGEQDNKPYIVMEYVPGGTLATYIDDMPSGLPTEEVLRLTTQIAGALDYAHRQRVIHRDFKPSNVLLDMDLQPYLADFGIARVLGETSSITGSGIIGTPAYMAPEMTSRKVTHLVDIYALGVTVFQMLAGQPPYQAEDPFAVAVAHVTLPVPSILNMRPDLPEEVQDVIEKAMAKDPAARYQTAGRLARDLAAALAAAPGEVPYAPSPPRNGSEWADDTTTLDGGAVETSPSLVTPGRGMRRARRRRGVVMALVGIAVVAAAIIGLSLLGVLPDLITGFASPSPTGPGAAPPTAEPTNTAAPTDTPEPPPTRTPTEDQVIVPTPQPSPTSTLTPLPTSTATPDVTVLLRDDFTGSTLDYLLWLSGSTGNGSVSLGSDLLTITSGTASGKTTSAISNAFTVTGPGTWVIETRVRVLDEDGGSAAWGFVGNAGNGLAHFNLQNRTGLACIARQDSPNPPPVTSQYITATPGSWHTYRLELSQTELRCIIDDSLVATLTDNLPWDVAMPVVLDRGSDGQNRRLQVDYIEVRRIVP